MEKTTRQDSRMAIRKNCGQNYIFVVLHFNLFGLAKQATSRTHLNKRRIAKLSISRTTRMLKIPKVSSWQHLRAAAGEVWPWLPNIFLLTTVLKPVTLQRFA